MTIGSLFAGIGGIELGLERAGLGPVLWQVEIDPFCRKVLAEHWPDAERYEDVTTIETLPYVDVICGGFPCQDISNAGKRTGIEGTRSGLWREYARIVRLVRPRVVIVENVSALLGRGLGIVLRDLAEIGYDAIWDCIPAQAIGAPHRRDRLFVVAHRDLDRQQSERGCGLLDSKRSPFGGHIDRCRSEALVNTAGVRCQYDQPIVKSDGKSEGEGRMSESTRRSTFPPPPNDLQAWGRVQVDFQPAVCRVAHGIPPRVDRLRALGNAVVPQVAEVIGRVVMELANVEG